MSGMPRPHGYTPPAPERGRLPLRSWSALTAGPPALRLAFVTETYPPEINGAARTVRQMVEGQIARGHRVHLTRPHQGITETGLCQPGLKTLLVPGTRMPYYRELRFGLPARRALLRAWREFRPQAVYVATEGPLGLSAVNAATILGIPCVSGFHTNFQDYSTHFGLGRFQRVISRYLQYFHNRCTGTIVPTQMLANQLTAQGYENLRVLPRGVDTRAFSPAYRSAALRRQWGLEESDLAVLHVGRISPEKNLTLAVRAFNAIRAREPRARMVLIGDGPEAAALKAAHADFIFCGMQTGAALSEHYASGDLLLMPSVTETFGNVVLEGMASGLPVVTYDYASGQEHIQPGRNGLLAWFGDEDDFVRCAVKGAAQRDYARTLAAEARTTALQLSWERADEQVERLFRELARQSPAQETARLLA